ncbi:MAG: hypothetical protein OEY22_03865 [Candidatus Bathyarchaeota archaeon]|nr:hypothetical protein [Candidatus Bathyarchaeota archaeon]MDH5787388.1 hypothetical protein [Candidatus Bathyarchaeota archaeon]
MFGSLKLKKPTKFLILLLTSILIGAVNAAIFYTLTMESQFLVSSPVIRFSSAPDEPSGSTVNDAWCMLNATSYPNATLTYEQALYIENTDGSNAHSFRLRHLDVSPVNGTATVGNWSSIKFMVYNSTDFVCSLNYTVSGTDWILEPSSGETNYYSVPASTSWWIRLETLSPATATTGNTCYITIAVDVQQ